MYPIYLLGVLSAVAVFALAPFEDGGKYLFIPAIIVLAGAVKQFQLQFQSLTLADGKLRYQTGMLSRSTRTMELSKVQDVRVDQSLMQRIVGTGDISIETAGETSRLTMTNIDQPQSVADAILEAAQGSRQAASR